MLSTRGPCKSDIQVRAHKHISTRTHTDVIHCLLSPLPSAKPVVSRSSLNVLSVDSGLNKRLLVAPSVGGQITLFAEVTADPCPSIQWMVNSSAVSGGGNYMIGNPCSSSPAGTTVFNFTLTITATAVTTGTYSATLINRNGSTNVQEVFVTPPGMLTVRRYSQSS